MLDNGMRNQFTAARQAFEFMTSLALALMARGCKPEELNTALCGSRQNALVQHLADIMAEGWYQGAHAFKVSVNPRLKVRELRRQEHSITPVRPEARVLSEIPGNAPHGWATIADGQSAMPEEGVYTFVLKSLEDDGRLNDVIPALLEEMSAVPASLADFYQLFAQFPMVGTYQGIHMCCKTSEQTGSSKYSAYAHSEWRKRRSYTRVTFSVDNIFVRRGEAVLGILKPGAELPAGTIMHTR